MGEQGKKRTLIEKIAAFIVDKRKVIYFVYAVFIILSLFTSKWVSVNNILTDYLPEDSETRQGIKIMESEFTTYATGRIMADNISYPDAEKIAEEIRGIDGVKSVDFDDTEKHYANSSALFTVNFAGDTKDERCSVALDQITEKLKDYDIYKSVELGDSSSKRLAQEMVIVMSVACLIIVGVLILTSKTYMEVPTLLITFLAAALLNKGTNFMFGTISFVSNSVAIVLQLALAIDYAIILCHRYTEERETKNEREAVIAALSKAIPEVAGSCLTTLAGLVAMTFMHFRIGFDLGIVLVKAIIFSIICVFTLMPGLLMSFSKLIDKTHHKSFVPKITGWGKIVIHLRFILPCIFLVVVVASFFVSRQCPYAYSTKDLVTFSKNESQIANEMIKETFKSSNNLAILVPVGDYKKEKALIKDLEDFPETTEVKGLAGVKVVDDYAVADELTPKQFSEITDVDVEKVRLLYSAYALNQDNYGKIIGGIDKFGVPLIDMFDYVYDQVQNGTFSLGDSMNDKINEIHDKLDDGRKQLVGKNYSRLVMETDLPDESPETYAFLDKVKESAGKYYQENTYLAGNSTNCRDLSSTFGDDNILISILSVLFVMLVLLLTFRSGAIPIILIIVIQGSVWINFSFPTLQNDPIFFLSYLVVSSIQMGANIDYAIVITNRYMEMKQTLKPKEAITEAISLAFPTILTSGTILASAGIIIGLLSSEASISSIGICLGRGTIISMFLVLCILPQLLLLGDKIIEKTKFKLPKIGKKKKDISDTTPLEFDTIQKEVQADE